MKCQECGRIIGYPWSYGGCDCEYPSPREDRAMAEMIAGDPHVGHDPSDLRGDDCDDDCDY